MFLQPYPNGWYGLWHFTIGTGVAVHLQSAVCCQFPKHNSAIGLTLPVRLVGVSLSVVLGRILRGRRVPRVSPRADDVFGNNAIVKIILLFKGLYDF
ncbi:hypothetical protein VTL71DRAFT_14740, partial [Oculimacula yallundae]